MTQGFERVREIRVGELEAPNRSTLRGEALLPVVSDRGGEVCHVGCRSTPVPAGQHERTLVTRVATFNAEFRAGYGYNQPASTFSSVGVIAAGSGDTASKYVARRETPFFIPENCTQCMECIAVCPDTALPDCPRLSMERAKTATTASSRRHRMTLRTKTADGRIRTSRRTEFSRSMAMMVGRKCSMAKLRWYHVAALTVVRIWRETPIRLSSFSPGSSDSN